MTLSTFESKKNYHHGDLHEALLVAALEILEEGVDPKALTLREAARRAGVSAMAPYRHFADKDALLAGVAMIGFKRLAIALTAADSNPDPREALLGQGVAYVTFAGDNPALFRLMFGHASPDRSPELSETSFASYKILANRVASLVSPDRVGEWTLLCWTTVHGLAMLALDGRLTRNPDSPAVLAERLLRLLGIVTGAGLTPS
ncbi:MAG: TetR/AcrR family transcriptional regulator [Beijerinckiaceae bacterium]|nr:TetR/AcrR family transcriptional regulator [Beijerinckiaceae bacterium]